MHAERDEKVRRGILLKISEMKLIFTQQIIYILHLMVNSHCSTLGIANIWTSKIKNLAYSFRKGEVWEEFLLTDIQSLLRELLLNKV